MKISDKINATLTYCDFYGYPVSLNLDSKGTYKSLGGGIMSIVTVLLIILFFWKGFIELLTMSTYNIRIQSDIHFNPEEELINLNQFMFSIKVDYQSQKSFEPTKQFFKVQVSDKMTLKNGTSKISNATSIQMKPCTLDSFKGIFGEEFNQSFYDFELNTYNCPTEVMNISLAGIYYSQLFKYVKIDIKECDATENCYNKTEREDLIQKYGIDFFKVHMAFSNFELDPQSSDILKPYIDMDFFLMFMPNSYKTKTDIYLQKNDFIEDKSILPLVNNIEQSKFFIAENIRTQIQIQPNSSFAEIYIRIAQDRNTYYKNYQQIDKFLAYVGGILKIIFFLFGFIVHQYNKYGFYVQLANKLYIFNIPVVKEYSRQGAKEEIEYYSLDSLKLKLRDRVGQIKNAIKNFQKGTKKLMHLHKAQRISNLNIGPIQALSQAPSQISEDAQLKCSTTHHDEMNFRTRSEFLLFTFKEILMCRKEIQMMIRYLFGRLFCRKIGFNKVEVQLVDKAVTMIKNDTDIAVLIDKLHDIDKLKKLLLTEEQILLFNYSPKPIVQTEQFGFKQKQLKVLSEQTILQDQIFKERDSDRSLGQQKSKTQTHHHHSHHHDDKLLEQKSTYNSIDSLHKLYKAYDYLYHQNSNDAIQSKVNHKLMVLIGEQLREIFEVSYLLEDDNFGNNKQHTYMRNGKGISSIKEESYYFNNNDQVNQELDGAINELRSKQIPKREIKF